MFGRTLCFSNPWRLKIPDPYEILGFWRRKDWTRVSPLTYLLLKKPQPQLYLWAAAAFLIWVRMLDSSSRFLLALMCVPKRLFKNFKARLSLDTCRKKRYVHLKALIVKPIYSLSATPFHASRMERAPQPHGSNPSQTWCDGSGCPSV